MANSTRIIQKPFKKCLLDIDKTSKKKIHLALNLHNGPGTVLDDCIYIIIFNPQTASPCLPPPSSATKRAE